MGGVYCPTCEAGVEVTATFCLSCGHDLTLQGPITATGHDLNQLKDVIRLRDDLSMAQKFDMIAQVETGADPIALGIAAAGDDHDDGGTDEAFSATAEVAPGLRTTQWNHKAADAAVELAATGTTLGQLKKGGAFNEVDDLFKEAMDIGRTATLHLLEVAQGAVLPANDALQSIPVLQPPTKSFCPKCGSDIHANAMLQWKKWTDMSTDALVIQLEAAMQASMMHVAASYQATIRELKDQLSDAEERAKSTPSLASKSASSTPNAGAKSAENKKIPEKEKMPASVDPKPAEKKETKAKPKPKAGGLFGAKKPKKTYDGEPGGKAEWFLTEALDTVYDPHGTGKPIKGAMILARSSEGNVRVRDVVRTYAAEGEGGISELAWTSPLTKYLIEAYDAC
jgi:hypothetical protein